MIDINPYLLNTTAVFIIAIIAGSIVFTIRSKQIRKLRKRVQELEIEMLDSHREILYLEEQRVKSYHSSATPVIPFKSAKASKTGK